MNKVLEDQLTKLGLPLETHIVIPKSDSIPLRSLKRGDVYTIIFNDRDIGDLNSGRVPNCITYIAEVEDIEGNLVKMNCSNGANNFYGWIPFEKISLQKV